MNTQQLQLWEKVKKQQEAHRLEREVGNEMYSLMEDIAYHYRNEPYFSTTFKKRAETVLKKSEDLPIEEEVKDLSNG